MKTDHGLLAECRATLAFVINVRPLFTGDILETGEAMLVLSGTVATLSAAFVVSTVMLRIAQPA